MSLCQQFLRLLDFQSSYGHLKFDLGVMESKRRNFWQKTESIPSLCYLYSHTPNWSLVISYQHALGAALLQSPPSTILKYHSFLPLLHSQISESVVYILHLGSTSSSRIKPPVSPNRSLFPQFTSNISRVTNDSHAARAKDTFHSSPAWPLRSIQHN